VRGFSFPTRIDTPAHPPRRRPLTRLIAESMTYHVHSRL
jgi:hypothetical protein